jgi:uncharacterized membrane protein (UPF0136 family)
MPNKFVLINSQVVIVYSHAVRKISAHLLYVLEFKQILLSSGPTLVYLAFSYLRNMRNRRKQVPNILGSKGCNFSVSFQRAASKRKDAIMSDQDRPTLNLLVIAH